MRSALIIIADDPRSSARPAEALRVAAGLIPWGRTRIDLYLRGPAVLLLSTAPDMLLEEENVRRYWPLLRDHEAGVYVEGGQPLLAHIYEPALAFAEMAVPELAALAAGSDMVFCI